MDFKLRKTDFLMSRNKKHKLFTFGVCNKIVNNGIYGQKMQKITLMNYSTKFTLFYFYSRKPQCSGYGENSKITYLRINMLAEKGEQDYCGIFISDPASDERSVAVAVRTHRTLELVDDKFYMITCGKAGFQNTRYVSELLKSNKFSVHNII